MTTMPTSTQSQARYAIYYAPEPETALWRFGSAVLGYDAASGNEVAQWVPAGRSVADWRDATAEPRRYGFHATLKAPFRLRAGASEAALIEALEAEAARISAAPLGPCHVAALGHFVAVVPVISPPALTVLEAWAVDTFEPFRAPLEPEDRARRLARPLTQRQTHYLERYGYPFVKEEFRFHMTLTGSQSAGSIGAVRDALARAYAEEVAEPSIVIDRLALFKQTAEDARFRIIASAPIRHLFPTKTLEPKL
jgi:hypothetical protein